MGRRSVEAKFLNPLFADTADSLIIFDDGHLSVLTGEEMWTKPIHLEREVTSVGVNEDNMGIYLGMKQGFVAVLH